MSKSLLFVDDSATMQTVAEITFRSSDWEFTGARTAAEARAAAAGKSLILVDAVMPDGSGYDLAKELKTAHPGATIVMVCGNSELYNESKGTAAGSDGHIVKPWQTDKVVEQLTEIASAGPSKAPAVAAPAVAAPAPAAAAAAPTPLAAAAARAPAPAAKSEPAPTPSPPRSATLMGMPTMEMPPPAKPLPAGVAAIKTSKPAIPDLKQAPVRTPAPPAAATSAAPARSSAPAPARAPLISQTPGKPIRLVLASQAEALARQTAQAGGLDSKQADALSSVSRELLEQIIWEVVPDLAETIIRDNLDTLTAKAR